MLETQQDYYKTYTSSGCFLVDQLQEGREPQLLTILCEWDDGVKGLVLPKGTVEQGEEHQETARRETIEETGYSDFQIISELGKSEFEFTQEETGNLCQKTIYWYYAELKSQLRMAPDLQADEKRYFKSYHWITLEEAQKSLLFETERILIPRLKELMK